MSSVVCLHILLGRTDYISEERNCRTSSSRERPTFYSHYLIPFQLAAVMRRRWRALQSLDALCSAFTICKLSNFGYQLFNHDVSTDVHLDMDIDTYVRHLLVHSII